MTGTGRDDGVQANGGPDRHRDEMTEVEAEAEAEVSDLETELVHLPHLRAADADVAPPRPGDVLLSGPAPNHHVGRQRFLVAYLRVALVATFVIGVVELLIPDQHRDAAGVAMVGVLVVAPIGRVLWLMVRWQRRGDWRFALVGAVLVGVVLSGLVAR